MLLLIHRKSQDPQVWSKAIAAYGRAVELYPNYNLGHAQLAWVHHLEGNAVAAAREAREALRLDELHPHAEQKLAELRVFDPGSGPPTEAVGDAEQLMWRLRNPP